MNSVNFPQVLAEYTGEMCSKHKSALVILYYHPRGGETRAYLRIFQAQPTEHRFGMFSWYYSLPMLQDRTISPSKLYAIQYRHSISINIDSRNTLFIIHWRGPLDTI